MVTALIIAVGKTERRENFNPQKEVGTIPAIRRVVMVFQRAGIERIVVVCDKDKTERLAARMNLTFLHNRKGSDMLDSVKTGLAFLQDKCTATMITHTDVPLFSVETVHTLMAADGMICIPSHTGKIGHPMLLRKECFPAILSYQGRNGLAGAAGASGFERRLIEVNDEGILINVNDENDYEHLVAGHNLKKLHPVVKISFAGEKKFYNPATHHLLQLIEETKSLSEACRRIGICRRKGRLMIALIKQQLGYPIVETQTGGATGGHSIVTKEGKELMARYTRFYAESKDCVQEIFNKCFAQEPGNADETPA